MIVLFAYPNVRHPNVASFPGLHRYSLIPGPDGDPFSWPSLRGGDGKDVRPTLPQHAASGYLDDLAGRLRYRAVFDLDPDDGATIVGRSVGGAAVAVEFRVGPGRIVAVPPVDTLAGSQRKVFTSSLLELVERMLEEPSADDAPVWVRRYDTPEASEARDELSAARDELKQAERRVSEAESLLVDTTRFQSMLWQSQNRGFDEIIQDAFRVLGYVTSASDDGLELRDGADTALVEVASSSEAVSERLYLTLQQRIEDQFLRRQQRSKGIIVANALRQTDPRIRRNPFPKTLINACETYGYALIPVEALFELVVYANEAADEPEALEEIRRSIADTAGVLEIALEEESDEVEEAAENDGAPAGNGAIAAPAEAG